jgi:hypothetical protein
MRPALLLFALLPALVCPLTAHSAPPPLPVVSEAGYHAALLERDLVLLAQVDQGAATALEPVPAVAAAPAPAAPQPTLVYVATAPAPKADAPPPVVVPPPQGIPPWTYSLGTLAGILAYLIRRNATDTPWLHEKVGAVVVAAGAAFLTACLTTFAAYVTMPTFSWASAPLVMLNSGIAAVGGAVGIANPSVAAGVARTMALLFVLGSSQLACATITPKTGVMIGVVATVQTVDDGIERFGAYVVTEEHNIEVAAITGCLHELPGEPYNTCTKAITEPRRRPIDKAKVAIRAYKDVLQLGAAAAAGDVAQAAGAVIDALGAVGIRVMGSAGPVS